MFRKIVATLILLLIFNGYVYVNIFEDYKKHHIRELSFYKNRITELESVVDEFKLEGLDVTVTMYHPIYPQTDKTPSITADGTRIRISKASEYKFVALSRNLLKRWGGPFNYGDFILIKGTSDKDGVYQVRDTMNSKWVNVVDILESKHVKPYKYENVHIYKMNWTDNIQLVNNNK